ncbi:hypothetical protein LBBP_01634 [Leptospira borgpetersenii serovar Ballum]|uniref:Uncharacterized protein n=1 Tax=Leptospira borgpetersenii serovar Ballum TaxID=280505 RepID=A0A0S2IQI9_LEPBO|nr:hypothetical protein LBBP_01634 [Leptospira borgpetersenii serovar Ballum]
MRKSDYYCCAPFGEQHFSLKNPVKTLFTKVFRLASRFNYKVCGAIPPELFYSASLNPTVYFVRKIKLQGSVPVLGQNLISNSHF